MEFRELGSTGVKVSALALGTMMFGRWGNPDPEDCAAIMRRAVDAGVNLIDTADIYSFGESEQIVGRAVSSLERSSVILATKFSSPMSGDPNQRGASRRWIVKACEDSLRRLDTDYIDLYQVHRPDESTDVDETLSALSDLVRAGKIRMFGTSTFPPEQLVDAYWTAERRSRERFRTEQPPYSILVRGIEGHVLPTAQRLGMGVISWSPLCGGWLSGRFGDGRPNVSTRDATLPQRPGGQGRYDLSIPENRRKLEIVTELAGVAGQAGLSMIELALGFALEHPAISSTIIGPRTSEQLDSQLAVQPGNLDPDTLDQIDRIVTPGTDIDPQDGPWRPAVLADATARRRTTFPPRQAG